MTTSPTLGWLIALTCGFVAFGKQIYALSSVVWFDFYATTDDEYRACRVLPAIRHERRPSVQVDTGTSVGLDRNPGAMFTMTR
jgi:hypothetical protein